MSQQLRWHRRPLRFELLEDRRILAVFSVSNTAEFGSGGLRTAIIEANDTAGKDEIVFDASLFGSGTPVIQLVTQLPVINEPVKIYSETGGDVIIQNAGSVQKGLFLTPSLGQGISEDFEISDLVFQDFQYGIHVDHTGGVPNSTLEGVTIVGNAFFDNERGIYLERPSYPFEIRDNQIFGNLSSSTNPEAGIWIDGTGPVPNTYGPVIDNNIIVDHEDYGIFVLGAAIVNLAITDNRIGADGTGAAGPNAVGILFQGADVQNAVITDNNEIVFNGDGIVVLTPDGIEISVTG